MSYDGRMRMMFGSRPKAFSGIVRVLLAGGWRAGNGFGPEIGVGWYPPDLGSGPETVGFPPEAVDEALAFLDHHQAIGLSPWFDLHWPEDGTSISLRDDIAKQRLVVEIRSGWHQLHKLEPLVDHTWYTRHIIEPLCQGGCPVDVLEWYESI